MRIPTPKLPYELPINCKLTFNESVVLNVCLHFAKNRNIQELPGISAARQIVNFRLVNPKRLPETVKPDSRAIAEITNGDTGIITKYILIVIKINQSQWKDATQEYGSVLTGVLIQEINKDSLNQENPFG